MHNVFILSDGFYICANNMFSGAEIRHTNCVLFVVLYQTKHQYPSEFKRKYHE
jgi:hypothetical protein